MQQSVFAAYAAASFAAAVVFIDMMRLDTAESAVRAAEAIADPRARFFHDPAHHAGRALARCFGWQHHVAWDCYLFYPSGARWDGEAPPPPEWYHQLQDREVWEEQLGGAPGSDWTECLAEQSEAPPEHFRTGAALIEALRASAGRVLAG